MLSITVAAYLGNTSILKPRPIPEAGLFTVTAWICNVTMYSADAN
jgi:hypothetical protein